MRSVKVVSRCGTTQESPTGKCKLKIQNIKNSKIYNMNFVVVEENMTPLI